MLRAPRVSQLTLCPLGQPEKAIGHESQIEPWLTLTTTLLDASETDERRYASKMNLENWENRGSSYQYLGWMSGSISLRPPVAGGVFFLDIPSYRTMLHWVGILRNHWRNNNSPETGCRPESRQPRMFGGSSHSATSRTNVGPDGDDARCACGRCKHDDGSTVSGPMVTSSGNKSVCRK